MLRRLSVVFLVAGLASVPTAVAAGGAPAEDAGATCLALDSGEFEALAQALGATDGVARVLPPICDDHGFTWNLTLQAGALSGTARDPVGCGTWPMTGAVAGSRVTLAIDLTGYTCSCETHIEYSLTLDARARQLTGTVYGSGYLCPNPTEAPCTARFCGR